MDACVNAGRVDLSITEIKRIPCNAICAIPAAIVLPQTNLPIYVTRVVIP
jgi:hypothetical protein